MTRSKYPRSARKAAAPLTSDPKEGVVSSASPVPTTAGAGAIFTAGATLATPTPTTGTKRQRDGDEDENENTFYGRRSVKSRSKGLKRFERNDVEQGKCGEKVKEGAALSATQAATPRGPGKRLKFDPEVHGAGLESRFLDLQKNDAFEKMVSPRKKALKDTDKVGGWDETKREALGASGLAGGSAPRKIATPKPVKVSSNPPLTTTKSQRLAQTEVLPEPQPVDHKISKNTRGDEAHETTIGKHVSTSSSASPTLEKRLRELASPTTSISRPAQSRNPFSSSPAVIKSSKPLTKPSFELPGDAHMKKRAIEREERKKRIEEAEKQKDEAKKQQQLQERFKSHMEKKITKKDQQQGSAPQVSTASPPAVHSTNLFSLTAPKASVTVPTTVASKPEQTQPSNSPLNSRRLTLDEVNQQLNNESVLEEQRKVEEAALRIRQEAAKKGKESIRLWAETMKLKAVKK